MRNTDFRALFRAMPAVCLALDPDPPRFTVLAATDLFTRATGRPASEIEGRGFFDLLEEGAGGDARRGGVAGLRSSLEEVLRTGRPHHAPPESAYILSGPAARRLPGPRDGPGRWRPRHTPVPDGAGSARYILHEMRWIPRAAGSRAAADAEALRLLVRRIVDEIPVGVVVHRGPHHVVDLVNPALRSMVGDRPLLGRTPGEAFPELPVHDTPELLDRVARLGERVRFDDVVLRHRLEGGGVEERQMELAYAPLRDGRGISVGVLGIARDVTETARLRRDAQRLRLDAESARMSLEELHVDLETRIADKTRELARSNAALAAEITERKRGEEARTELLRRLSTAEEEERRRLSRELHDHMGQLVTGLLLGLKSLEDRPGAEIPTDEVAELRVLAERVAETAHDVAVKLRPVALDSFGLEVAVRAHVDDWSERHGISTDLHLTGLEDGPFDREVEEAVFRVVQEGLTNVLKHARAGMVSLLVERRDGTLSVILEDDGLGFDATAVLEGKGDPTRLGLLGLRERIGRLGGTLQAESEAGEGTTLFARIPTEAPASDAEER